MPIKKQLHTIKWQSTRDFIRKTTHSQVTCKHQTYHSGHQTSDRYLAQLESDRTSQTEQPAANEHGSAVRTTR